MPSAQRHPDETIYTFWDFFRNAYERDAGLRIDHLLLNPAVVDAHDRCGRRPRRARLGKAERPCADLGGSARLKNGLRETGRQAEGDVRADT